MKTFKSFLRENMLDSDREVNYYASLAKEKMKLMEPKEPTYHKVFLGKINKIGNLLSEENVERSRNSETGVSDQIHNNEDYMVFDNEEAPNVSDIFSTHQELLDHTSKIPHEAQHKRAVIDYTGLEYTDINQYLYGTNPRLLRKANQDNIDNLKELIGRSVIQKPLTVFTGIKFEPDKIPVENGFRHVITPAFSSTSLAHSEARNFAKDFPHVDENGKQIMNSSGNDVHIKNIVRLNIPENAAGYYAEGYSSNPGEKEFILHPDSRYILWPKPTRFVSGHTWEKDRIYQHWYGRLVHDGIKHLPIPESDPYHPKNLGI